MSELWTPDGARPEPDGTPTPDSPTTVRDRDTNDRASNDRASNDRASNDRASNEDDGTVEADSLAALAEARRRLAEVPAEVVVVNHAMGLYELAAIHLSAEPPSLSEAVLAIDGFACLVEGLGDRLGPDASTLRDALNQIRLAFVQIKGSAGAEPTDES